MKIIAAGSAGGQSVVLTATTQDDSELTDDARGRIQLLLSREAQRIAEIAYVNLKDQAAAPEEAARLRNIPRERPVTFVAPRGEQPQTFWQTADGRLVPEREANGKIAEYHEAAKAHPFGVPQRDGGTK